MVVVIAQHGEGRTSTGDLPQEAHGGVHPGIVVEHVAGVNDDVVAQEFDLPGVAAQSPTAKRTVAVHVEVGDVQDAQPVAGG